MSSRLFKGDRAVVDMDRVDALYLDGVTFKKIRTTSRCG